MADGKTADLSQPGKHYPCHLPGVGFHDWPLEVKGELAYVECVKLTTKGGGIWRGSKTTPFNFTDADADLQDDQWAFAPDMEGREVFVRTPDGDEVDKVVKVEDIGLQWVIPQSFGGRSFPAGDTPERLIYSHNIYKRPGSAVNLLALRDQLNNLQSFGGNSSYITTRGQLQNMSPGAAMGYTGGQAYQPGGSLYSGPTGGAYVPQGGYLGSGSYAGMGSGLAAAGYPATPSPQQGSPTAPMGNALGGAVGSGMSGFNGLGLPSFSSTPHHLNFGQRLTELLLPGRQFDRKTGQFNGQGSIWRGVGQLATQLPIATGYEVYRKIRDGNKEKGTP